MLRQRLGLTADQQKQVDALQKEVDAKLDKILTSEQKQQLKQMRERGPGGFGPGGPPPGGGGPAGSARLPMATVRLPAGAAGRAAMALRHRPINRCKERPWGGRRALVGWVKSRGIEAIGIAGFHRHPARSCRTISIMGRRRLSIGGQGDTEVDLGAEARTGFDGDPAAEQRGPLLHPEEAQAAAARGAVTRGGHVEAGPVIVDDQVQPFTVPRQGDVHLPRPGVSHDVGQRLLRDAEALGLRSREAGGSPAGWP